MQYIRKIESEKWVGKSTLAIASACDVAVGNGEVSVWMNDQSAPEKPLHLILAYLLTRNQIKDVWYVPITDTLLNEQNLNLRQEDSTTPYIAMQKAHTNILTPTWYELGYLVEIMCKQVNSGEQVYITEQELKECFYQLIKEDKIEIDLTRITPSKKDKMKSLREAFEDIEKLKGEVDFSGHTHSLFKR